MIDGTKPPGFVAIGIFLFFGAMMAGLAATTLLWRGTVLDRVWTLNPTAYRQLSPFDSKVAILFLLLSAALVVSGIGWFRRRRWGWRLAVAIIAIQSSATSSTYSGATGCVAGSVSPSLGRY